MFHFPGCPPMRLWIHLMVTGHCPGRVPPFGNLWINVYLQLPTAYRSLSRPSSAISAMASTLRSYSLDLLRKSLGFAPIFADRLPVLVRITFLRLSRCDANFDLCSQTVPPSLLTGIFHDAVPISFRRNQFLSCAVFKVRSQPHRG